MRFALYGVSFDENDGGSIVMHALCSQLCRLGYDAAMFPWPVSAYRKYAGQGFLRSVFNHVFTRALRYHTGPFGNPVSRRLTTDTIVIYPEIVAGDPLQIGRVVRWILYKLDGHHRPISFNNEDFLFYYSEDFVSADLVGEDRLLRLTHISPDYVQTNFGARLGDCVLFRKGRDRCHDQHPADAVVIDGLSHSEIALVFNKTERFYCYDLYTYYTVYAALCGCVPIVIPMDGLEIDNWVKREDERLGVAYGVDDQDWAIATRNRLIDHLASKAAEEAHLVQRFAAKCAARFGV